MIVRMVYLYTDQSMKSQKNKSKRRQASVKRDRGGTPLTELAKVTNHHQSDIYAYESLSLIEKQVIT